MALERSLNLPLSVTMLPRMITGAALYSLISAVSVSTSARNLSLVPSIADSPQANSVTDLLIKWQNATDEESINPTYGVGTDDVYWARINENDAQPLAKISDVTCSSQQSRFPDDLACSTWRRDRTMAMIEWRGRTPLGRRCTFR